MEKISLNQCNNFRGRKPEAGSQESEDVFSSGFRLQSDILQNMLNII
jgi:hypothetical protein